MESKLHCVIFILLSVLRVSQSSYQVPGCPVNLPSTSLMKEHDGLCYQFVGTEKYWDKARDYCLQYNGRLVKIGSPSVNRFILKELSELWWKNNGIWIGLNDLTKEQNWEWTPYRGERSEKALWFNWASGRSLFHNGNDCVRMERNGGLWLWKETACSSFGYTYRFICEYKVKVASTTPATETSPAETSKPIEETLHETSEYVYTTLPIAEDLVNEARFGEVKSDASVEQSSTSTAGLWMIIAGCVTVCVFALLSVCILIRNKRTKKSKEVVSFRALERASNEFLPPLGNEGYVNRPACPLPFTTESEFCTPTPYYSLAKGDKHPARAESNVYLNSKSLSGPYCAMNQSTSSLDELPPPPANPGVTYSLSLPRSDKIPAHSYSNQADEYLCPSELSRDSFYGYDVNVDDEYRKHGEYDQPRCSNVYDQIPDAPEPVYNNIDDAS